MKRKAKQIHQFSLGFLLLIIILLSDYDICVQYLNDIAVHRVPTRPGKPGKMKVHLENLEISWNFEKFNKYHGKMT